MARAGRNLVRLTKTAFLYGDLMQMRPVRIQAKLPAFILLMGIVLQAGFYLALWISYVTHPDFLKRADFVSFYAVGKIANTVGFSHIYDLELQHSVQQDVLGHSMNMNEILMFVHTPLLLPLQALVAKLDYTHSYIVWEVILTFFLGLGIYCSYKIIKVHANTPIEIPFILAAEFLFYPIFISVLKGQDTVFLLTGVMIWVYGLIVSNDRTAGLGLALTVIRPQLALLLAIPFFFNRRKIFWWFLTGASVLTIYCLLMVNFQGVTGLLNTISIGLQADGYSMSEITMFNLTGLLVRNMPGLNSETIHLIGWIAYGAAVVGLSLLLAGNKQIDFKYPGLAIVLGLLTSPHLHYHDLGLLILPILGIALSMVDQRNWQGLQPTWLIAGVSILMAIFDNSPLRFGFAYFLMAVLAVFPWFFQRIKRDPV